MFAPKLAVVSFLCEKVYSILELQCPFGGSVRWIHNNESDTECPLLVCIYFPCQQQQLLLWSAYSPLRPCFLSSQHSQRQLFIRTKWSHFADCLVFGTVSAVQNMSEISHGNRWWFNIGLRRHSLSAFIRRYAFHLQSGQLRSHTCPLLWTKMMIYVLSANQHGRPRRLLTCSRQYGPTKTWETRWTKQAGPRATSRYLLLWFLAKRRANTHS